MRNFSKSPTLSIGNFQKVQREVIYSPYAVRENEKPPLNCPKIVAYMVKIVKFLVCIISEHPKKAISLMFETETLGPCLVRKLKWGGMGLYPHPSLPPQWLNPSVGKRE